MAPKPKDTTVDSAAAPKGNRRSPRLASSAAAPPPPVAVPDSRKRKKAKTAPIPVTAAEEEETEVKDEDPEPQENKKGKTAPALDPVTAAEKETVDKEPLMVEQDPTPEPEIVDASKEKTIVVEHCKQCNSFKTRALQVKEALEKDVEGVKVVVNPEKPRKGCFEVREEGGEVFLSLLDMKRPFKKMKDLNMGEVISEIVEKIK